MKTFLAFFFFLVIACTQSLHAQDTFYDENTIQEIRLTFSESNWRHILDSLFTNYGDEGRLYGNITINGKLLNNVGVRYKGFSSWNNGAMKNPFNIDLDKKIKYQNYQGHTKLKLSNVIEDPSFVREALSYEIARNYMPASRANFANLYVNDTLIGLYTNVEAVDKYFVADHFGSSTNAFFKGEPDTLVYPFGQNSNLAYTHGNDSSGYFPYYKLESGFGWTDLVNFIRILNNSTDSIEHILNVDRSLWMHAFNYSLLNFDSYIGYSQNFYLYQDDLGKFNPIIWDLNMSFGSFRESDGSYNFLGLSIPKIERVDPLEHLHFSISPRPLMTNLFVNDTWRRMYLAHIRTIIKENFMSNTYYTRAKEIQALIDPSVRADNNKFYSYQDFLMNLDTTIGGTGLMMQYPGIKNLMEARVNYLSAYKGISTSPSITAISLDPAIPSPGNTIWITANVTSAKRVMLAYRYGSRGVFTRLSMLDDGNSHDGVADDGIFGCSFHMTDSIVQYYLYAENDTSGIFSPERAEYEFYTLQPQIQAGDLVINELGFNGDGLTGNEDPATNNWIELLNRTDALIRLKDFTLSSELQGITWNFPDTLVGAGSYFLVWADDSGGKHANFTLSLEGSMLILGNPGGKAIDSLEYGSLVSNKSLGRYPNGYGSYEYMETTPGEPNAIGTTPASGFVLYPSPARVQITIEFNTGSKPYSIEIYNLAGKQVFVQQYSPGNSVISALAFHVDVSHFCSGLYMVKLNTGQGVYTRKFIVY